MDFYQLSLVNGQKVATSHIYLGYKLNMFWPLSDHASHLQYFIKYVIFTTTLLSYIVSNFAQLIFFYEHSHNVSAVSECLCTWLVGTQFVIRTIVIGLRQRQFKSLLERFYKEIYITSSNNSLWHSQFSNNMRFITVFSASYWFAMVLKVFAFPLEVAYSGGLHSQNKPFLYRMSITWYDAQDPMNFIITSLYTSWLIVSCSILGSADDYLLCKVLIHTSYRYKELQEELQEMFLTCARDARVNDENHRSNMQILFGERLRNIFQKQQKLNSFVQEAKQFFTYQIFLCLSFGMVMLCVIFFHIQKIQFGVDWIMYIMWLNTQVTQFIIIGYFGQMLINETCALGNSYYECQWELMLGNYSGNKSLLNDIKFAIMHSERGAELNGLKIFSLNHRTVSYALRSAVSYYMFLNAVNEENNFNK